MALELRNSNLPRVLSDLVADFSDLVQKELQLGRAEMAANLTTKLQAGIWISVAGVLGLIAFLFVLEAIVFWIAGLGVGLPWSCVIVAVVLAIGAAIAYAKARADAQRRLMPTRTVHQIREDVATAREKMT